MLFCQANHFLDFMYRVIFSILIALSVSDSAIGQVQYLVGGERAAGVFFDHLVASHTETFATPPVRVVLALRGIDVSLGYWQVEGDAGCNDVAADCAPGVSHLIELSGSVMLGRQSTERPVSVQVLANGAMRTWGSDDGKPIFTVGLGTRISSRLQDDDRAFLVPSFSIDMGITETHFHDLEGYVVGSGALAFGIIAGNNSIVLEGGYVFALGNTEERGLTFKMGVLRRF